jgi:hypothetical protein
VIVADEEGAAERQRVKDLAQAEMDNYARNHKPVKPKTTKTGE